MKVETSQVTKIHISNIEGIEPITVILEDLGQSSGKLIVKCSYEVWTCQLVWSEESSFIETISSMNVEYLQAYLSGSEQFIIDGEKVQSDILHLRRNKKLDRLTARKLYSVSFKQFVCVWLAENEKLIARIYGGDKHSVPHRDNWHYLYERKIFQAVISGAWSIYQEMEVA